jgi:phosphomannomutase
MGKLLNTIEEIPKDKSVFVFDLDGTLAESKMKIDGEMGTLLSELLAKSKIAIISGEKFEHLESQLSDNISRDGNLLLLPLDAGSFYENRNGVWQEVYSSVLSNDEKKRIFEAFDKAFKDAGYVPPADIHGGHGESIEDRGSQITFSALGQHAPLDEKNAWSDKNDNRDQIVERLREYLPDMDVKVAGVTSIDVTKKGIDKKFGVEQIMKYLNVPASELIFFGDSLGPDGNDYPVTQSEVDCFRVNSVDDTKKALQYMLS